MRVSEVRTEGPGSRRGFLFQRPFYFNVRSAMLARHGGRIITRTKGSTDQEAAPAAFKALQTKRRMSAFAKGRAAEASSKEALRIYCQEHRWKVAFFEGATGSPRTGIIDAVAFRLGRRNADALDIRLIQLKGGNAGINGPEIARLKKAASGAIVKWLIAAYDGETLHVVPDDPEV
jgi:hypothetical protein